MGFEITKAEVLRDRMITWFAGVQRKITDFIVGGKTYSKFEAIAVELESMLFQIYQAITKAIPVSVYKAFDFNLAPAVKASGSITFSAIPAPVSNILIPAGTQISTESSVSTQSIIYATAIDVTLLAGQTSVQAAISCTIAGASGNVGVNTLTVLKTLINGITSVTNPAAISSGIDTELESARKTRFIAFIGTITRGTDSAVIYGAKTAALLDSGGNITEKVVNASVVGPPAVGSAGLLSCYIYNGSTGASSALIAAAQKIIDGDSTVNPPVPGYKAAGVVVTVSAVTTVPVSVTIAATALAEVDKVALQTTIVNTVTVYLQSFSIGDAFQVNELIKRVKALDGIYNLSLTLPAADVAATSTQVIVPGTITVTVA